MNLLNAPEQGIMYALYRDRVVYEPYKREQLENEENLMRDLLELHLFDDTKEYRFIRKRKGDVEVCIEDSTVSHDDYYTEQIYTLAGNAETLDETSKRNLVEVVNYIIYGENDLMTIPNYRLKEVKAR